MLGSLSIQNLQSHRRTKMDFHPGVNIIVGDTGAGKTAIIRAIRWATSNRPLSDNFRSSWGGKTQVKIGLLPEKSKRRRTRDIICPLYVVRTRNKKDNSYTLVRGKERLELKALKGGVPDEVSNSFNINEKVNFQRQLDAPYLLGASSGEASRSLNDAVGLAVIDTSLSWVASKQRTAGQKLVFVEEKMQALKGNLAGYENIAGMEELVVDCENSLKRLLRVEKGTQTIQTCVDSISKIDLEITALPEGMEDDLKMMEEMVEDLRGAKEIGSRISFLSDLIVSFRSLEAQLSNFDKVIRVNEEEFKKLMPRVCPLCGR